MGTKEPRPSSRRSRTQNMTAPPAAVDGHTAPPDPAAEAVIPAMPPIATGKRILTGSKTPGKTLQNRRKRGENRPSRKRRDSRRRFRNHRRLRGTALTPSWVSRLASRPGSSARKRAGEPGNRPLDR